MTDDDDYSHLPVVTAWTPTRDGKGRLFKLEPGKRIVLEKYDSWEPHEGESMLKQVRRVRISKAELDRREQAARNLRERMCVTPYYREMDRKHGMLFWRRLQGSAVLAD